MSQCRLCAGFKKETLSVPRETDGATASANKEVRKAQEHTQRGKGDATTTTTKRERKSREVLV